MNNEEIIVKMKFGSHLYGTATAASDIDFKGVFFPTKEQIFLGKIPKSYSNSKKKAHGEKNTSDDIDEEIYSLHYFIKLACEGQTVALDMLHAPDNMIIDKSDVWDSIIENRSKFYTKNLNAFVGYARKQAAKYSIRGSRLNAAKVVLDLFEEFKEEEKLTVLWSRLPIGDYCYLMEDSPQGVPQFQICGKIYQQNATIGYVKKSLGRFYENYGQRAKMAAENKGIDWKAISHAFRAAFQVKQLLTEKTIIFPLKEAKFLTKVKLGELDYSTEAAPQLEDLMDEIEILSKNSDLPEKADRKFWDSFIIERIDDSLQKITV